jgi:hypothetical protein
VSALRRTDLAEKLRWAVQRAGTRAADTGAAVELAPALAGAQGSGVRAEPRVDRFEERLRDALTAMGASVVVFDREGGTKLAIFVDGRLLRGDIVEGPAGDPEQALEQVVRFVVTEGSLADPAGADAVSARICAAPPFRGRS